MTEEEKRTALENAIPRKPVAHELGGDIYYTCHWIKCENTVYRWQNYCDRCGQKLDWSGK